MAAIHVPPSLFVLRLASQQRTDHTHEAALLVGDGDRLRRLRLGVMRVAGLARLRAPRIVLLGTRIASSTVPAAAAAPTLALSGSGSFLGGRRGARRQGFAFGGHARARFADLVLVGGAFRPG